MPRPTMPERLGFMTAFLMGMHACVVPTKYGVMPEVLQSHMLSRGNGVLESFRSSRLFSARPNSIRRTGAVGMDRPTHPGIPTPIVPVLTQSWNHPGRIVPRVYIVFGGPLPATTPAKRVREAIRKLGQEFDPLSENDAISIHPSLARSERSG